MSPESLRSSDISPDAVVRVRVRSFAVTGQVKSVTSRLEPVGTESDEENCRETDLSADARELSGTENPRVAEMSTEKSPFRRCEADESFTLDTDNAVADELLIVNLKVDTAGMKSRFTAERRDTEA